MSAPVNPWADVERVFRDGDAWCAVGRNFVDIQESPAGFGATPTEAAEDLAVAVRREREIDRRLREAYERAYERCENICRGFVREREAQAASFIAEGNSPDDPRLRWLSERAGEAEFCANAISAQRERR